jgi:MFS family permease
MVVKGARSSTIATLSALASLSADGWLLVVARGVRTFAYGFLSVVLGLYLAALGHGEAEIGVVFAAAMAGGAATTLLVTAVADRLGRRRMLRLGALLMALAGSVFALTDNLALLVLAALVGAVSPSGGETGPFLAVEQAALPQTTRDEHRTTLFAWYNLVGSLATAVGALVAALPAVVGLDGLDGYRLLVWCYVLAGLALFLVFARLSPAVEVEPIVGPGRRPRVGLHRSRRIVAGLAALYAVDAFAGGFIVQGLLAYWFHWRFGVDETRLGALFFGTNLLSALSYLVAARVARRFGLLKTMVFTHLPSNLILLLVPLMPTFPLAALLLLARHALSQMDVPTRQSYTVAVVDPDERSAAAGITTVARNVASAIAPAFAGATLTSPIGLPFLIAGSLKAAYDLTLYAAFRHVKPPEEHGSPSTPDLRPAPSGQHSN